MLESMISKVKKHNPNVLEFVDVNMDSNLIFALTEKQEGEKSTVIAYQVDDVVKEVSKVTAYWENGQPILDVTENGITRKVQIDQTKITEASACTTAVEILCGIGGIAACNAACRAIPVIGILLGFTVCRTLCGSIVGEGCDAAKRKFC
ncbi:hypothetical protein MXL46_11220 [Heyndrickxia sporothermodurans]|uniref:hypothetical protein n=1 Tax=Heyndrickxia sporothermodurans TaxID=46224 RepID=UPI002DB8F799|nr:hypothetical protein [Heyndrickxia sporothermodurans]MEB6549656.1 hypothetical protein [Heyndrickxia sporothermodurans]